MEENKEKVINYSKPEFRQAFMTDALYIAASSSTSGS